jgi:hypothetical protein
MDREAMVSTLKGFATNPNSLGPELVQISEIVGLVKQYIVNGGATIYCAPK